MLPLPQSKLCFSGLCFLVIFLHSLSPGLQVSGTPLRVASFNIRVFGVRKMNRPDVVNVLKQVLTRYDIVLIQEIRDSSNTAIRKLLREINRVKNGSHWEMVLSRRLGRRSSKEQYAFFYNPSKVSVKDVYQWPDDGDYFEREPFIVHFRPVSPDYTVGGFGFLGVHVKPETAEFEIDKLTDVYNSVSAMWGLQDMLIGGDLNADCSYVRKKEWANITLRHDPRFVWTIGDRVDTTMTNSNCAYDRLIIAGRNLLHDYVPGTARPYKYDVAMNISRDLALKVSDHYPVELLLL